MYVDLYQVQSLKPGGENWTTWKIYKRKIYKRNIYRENIPIYGSRKSLSEQHGTKGCLGNYKVQMTEKQHWFMA